MSLSLKEKEQLSEKVKEFPVLYDKAAKEYKDEEAVNNAWRSAEETLDFDIFRITCLAIRKY